MAYVTAEKRVRVSKGTFYAVMHIKKETEISTSPLNKLQMDKIAYKPDGTIFTEPKDEAMDKDINETLLLNGVRKPDGSVRDTSTEILKGRRDAYHAYYYFDPSQFPTMKKAMSAIAAYIYLRKYGFNRQNT